MHFGLWNYESWPVDDVYILCLASIQNKTQTLEEKKTLEYNDIRKVGRWALFFL